MLYLYNKYYWNNRHLVHLALTVKQCCIFTDQVTLTMLFQQPDWGEEDGDGAPQLSALTWGAVQNVKKKKNKESEDRSEESKDGITNETPKKKRKKIKKKSESENGTIGGDIVKKAGKLSAKIGHGLAVTAAYKLDKFTNSPSATKSLLEKEDEEEPKKSSGQVVGKLMETARKVGEAGKELGRSLSSSTVMENEKQKGHLLTLGEKFKSQEAFLRFIGLPGKGKRGNKRKRGEEMEEDQNKERNDSSSDNIEQEEVAPVPPPRKKRREGGVDISKLREVLAKDQSEPVDSKLETEKKLKKTLAEEAKLKLSASRFRYLNEQLYTQPGNASAKLFKSDQSLFTSYHQGFQHQAKQWPIDPLNTIIADCLRLGDEAVIADFGCGEARLSRSVENKVYSFDLVALNDRVTACDMANVPLADNSVDVAVFCLALMGTNIRDFLFEAARVLKVGGTLKIAELESRFQGEVCSIDTFIAGVQKYGFKNSWKDLKKDFFYFLDFKKVQDIKKKKGKLPEIELKPCLYKKR